jgi:hypothetical protein
MRSPGCCFEEPARERLSRRRLLELLEGPFAAYPRFSHPELFGVIALGQLPKQRGFRLGRGALSGRCWRASASALRPSNGENEHELHRGSERRSSRPITLPVGHVREDCERRASSLGHFAGRIPRESRRAEDWAKRSRELFGCPSCGQVARRTGRRTFAADRAFRRAIPRRNDMDENQLARLRLGPPRDPWHVIRSTPLRWRLDWRETKKERT